MKTERARSRTNAGWTETSAEREENTAYLNLFCHPAGRICNCSIRNLTGLSFGKYRPRAKMRRRTTSTTWIYAG